MDACLDILKIELERFGETNDSAVNERSRRMLNVTRDTGEFLAVQVLATAAQRVLEIGTSNGYSTLWLAEAAQAVRGSVTTVECDDYKAGLASVNFARSGLAQHINLVKGEPTTFLRRINKSAYDADLSWILNGGNMCELVARRAPSATSGRSADCR